MTIANWFMIMAFGAALGLIGQAIRAVIGIRKDALIRAEAAASGKTPPATASFNPLQLISSLLIGGAAGAVAAVVTGLDPAGIDKAALLALVSAGYAGGDFIEGIMRKPASPAP